MIWIIQNVRIASMCISYQENSQAKAWREFFKAINASSEEIPESFERVNFSRGEVKIIILVFSDSHTDTRTMESVIARIKPGMVIHLGDHISDAEDVQALFTDIPFKMVRGNCDNSSSAETTKIIQAGEHRFLITHGHAFDSNVASMVKEAERNGAKAVLYGHTHVPAISLEQGVIAMNPGTVSGLKSIASFGVIELNGADITCRVVSAKGFVD